MTHCRGRARAAAVSLLAQSLADNDRRPVCLTASSRSRHGSRYWYLVYYIHVFTAFSFIRRHNTLQQCLTTSNNVAKPMTVSSKSEHGVLLILLHTLSSG